MFRPLHRASTPVLWRESVRKHAGSLESRGKGVVKIISCNSSIVLDKSIRRPRKNAIVLDYIRRPTDLIRVP